MKYTFSNPSFNGVSAKQFSFDVPDENKLFKDSGGGINILKGGQRYKFDPSAYYNENISSGLQMSDLANAGVQRNDQLGINYKTLNIKGKQYNWGGGKLYDQSWNLLGDAPESNDGRSVINNISAAAGYGALPNNQGEIQTAIAQKLGIDFNKLPEYNMGDVETYLGDLYSKQGTGQPYKPTYGQLSADEIKNLYGAGGIMGQAGQATERDLTGAEAPKLITGANGPVLADGTPIKPEDYAKYGITDYKIPPTTATAPQTPQNAQGAMQTAKQYIRPDGQAMTPENAEQEANFKALGWKEAGATNATSTANQPQYQILNTDAMKKYTPDQYERLADGRVVLKAGVQPIEGTVKQISANTGNTITDPATGTTYEALPGGTAGKEITTGAGTTSGDPLIDAVVDATGDPNASDEEILAALENLKTGQIDPYYKQLISQAQADVTQQINRTYEDRIRQLQTESYNLAENIRGAQKSLEASGMTFSGEAIRQLGSLSAFAQPTPQALTPAQLGQETPVPTMTPAQMGIEGDINMQNRLYAESSRTGFNRTLEDINKEALRLLGTQGVAGLGLPASGQTQPTTTGTMQYNYANTLQNLYGNLTNQEGGLTDLNKLFL